jgi:hypothetical protein
LLVFDPADDLIPVEDQSAVGLEPEVRKPSRYEGLPYSPGRTADERGNVADAEWRPKRCRALRLMWPYDGAGRRGERPWFAQNWPLLPGPSAGPAEAQGRWLKTP